MESAEYNEDIAAWRKARDKFFAEHYATPLADEDLESFCGLRYYPVDPLLRFEVELEPASGTIEITSSTGSATAYRTAGWVTISFAAGSELLQVLRGEDDELYIPFRDSTCGTDSYLGGRYVSVEEMPGRGYEVDFNKAINPYCAYDPDFSCPLPPPENCLSFPIAAGELDYR